MGKASRITSAKIGLKQFQKQFRMTWRKLKFDIIENLVMEKI